MTSPYSLTKRGPDNVSAGSNYYLPIYDHQGQGIESLLWMFDSHDDDCRG